MVRLVLESESCSWCEAHRGSWKTEKGLFLYTDITGKLLTPLENTFFMEETWCTS